MLHLLVDSAHNFFCFSYKYFVSPKIFVYLPLIAVVAAFLFWLLASEIVNKKIVF